MSLSIFHENNVTIVRFTDSWPGIILKIAPLDASMYDLLNLIVPTHQFTDKNIKCRHLSTRSDHISKEISFTMNIRVVEYIQPPLTLLVR